MKLKIQRPSGPFVLYPFFLLLLFVFNTFRRKLLFAPLELKREAVFLIFVLVFWLLVQFIFSKACKEKIRGGIVALFVLLFSLFYFDIYYSLFGIKFIYNLVYYNLFQKFHIVLFLLMGLLVFTVFLLLKRAKGKLTGLNNYLNLIFALFLLWEIYQFAFQNLFAVKLQDKINTSSIKIQQEKRRNVYFIVLDAYTGSPNLKKFWNYDNKELTGFLKDKGFFVAEKSRSNYNSTPFSIASTLNLSYLNLKSYEEAQKVQISQVYDLVNNSVVVRTFAENGYRIINQSIFDLGGKTALYNDPNYHQINLFDRTVFFLFTEKLNITDEDALTRNLGEENLKIFSRLNSIELQHIQPVFCYAHLMMPHLPFFYDERGNKMSEEYARNEESRKEKYLKQLKYTNQLLMNAIDNILAHEKGKPIIIIQGDHGFRDLKEIPYEERLSEASTIFNVYLFPDSTSERSLYDSISPVNSFRVVFNTCFGTSLPLLKDEAFNTELKGK